ncbi:MAG: GPI anchored serine-threonine rich family protein [Candidatus Lokiarchaeota archaeon]|nr:GPI anchored serine-threonine rich family protein [Candidatus Lokiarchaeota archaeon]
MKLKYRSLIVTSLLFLALAQLLFTSNGSAFVKVQSIVVYADADATTIDGSAENYGSADTIQAGLALSAQREIFMRFSLLDRPEEYENVIITLYVDYNGIIEGEMNLTVCYVTEDWEESTISGTNEPAKGDFITNVTVSASDIMVEINVTSAVATGDYLNICIYNHVNRYVRFWSKESSYSKPRLFWYYLEEVDFTITSPTSGKICRDKLKITWETTGTISKISLYVYSGEDQVDYITSGINNEGTYTWNIPDYYKGTYRIKIVDFSNSSIYAFSEEFEIGNFIPGYNSILVIVVGTISIVAVTLRIKKRK